MNSGVGSNSPRPPRNDRSAGQGLSLDPPPGDTFGAGSSRDEESIQAPSHEVNIELGTLSTNDPKDKSAMAWALARTL